MRESFAFLALLLGASPASGVEEPEYEVLFEQDDYEVRRYPVVVVAEMRVEGSFEQAGNDAFRPLADFIAGANAGASEISMTAPVTQRVAERPGEEIAMTAPVTQRASSDGSFVVQFVMPAEYTIETLPRPTDSRIRLREEPARVVAVHRYSGTWSEKRYREREARLREAVVRDGLEITGEPVWARFDPPFMPWFWRRNEIWLPVVWRGAPPEP